MFNRSMAAKAKVRVFKIAKRAISRNSLQALLVYCKVFSPDVQVGSSLVVLHGAAMSCADAGQVERWHSFFQACKRFLEAGKGMRC